MADPVDPLNKKEIEQKPKISKLAIFSFILLISPCIFMLFLLNRSALGIGGYLVYLMLLWLYYPRYMLILTIITSITSIISIVTIKKYGLRGRGLAIIVLVISIVLSLLEILAWLYPPGPWNLF